MIDTDILIFIEKKRKTEELLEKYDMYITFVTLYEYIRGLKRRGKKSEEIEEIKSSLSKIFGVLWPTNETLMLASEIWAELADAGMLIDDRDLLIGALCIENKMPLWTFNIKHFERLTRFGLKILKV